MWLYIKGVVGQGYCLEGSETGYVTQVGWGGSEGSGRPEFQGGSEQL